MLSIRFKKAIGSISLFHALKLLSSGFAQLCTLYLVYVLSPAEYGEFAILASVAQLLYILSAGWTNGVVINIGSQSFGKNGAYKDVVYYRIAILVISFIIVCAIYSILSPWIELYINVAGIQFYVFLLFISYIFYDHASQLLYPGDRHLVQATAEFLATFCFFIVVVLGVHSAKEYVVAYFAISCTFAAVVTYLFFIYSAKESVCLRYSNFKKILHYSGWHLISALGIYIVNVGNNYVLVANEIPLSDIGLYNLAYRLYAGYAPIFSLFGILIPKLIHSSEDGILLVENNILKITALLSILYLLIGLVLPQIFEILSMQRYSMSISYYYWLFPAFVFTCYINLMNTAMVNTEKFRASQVGIFLQCLLLAMVSFPLVYRCKVWGALAAITISSLVAALYFYYLYNKTKAEKKICNSAV